MRRLWFVALLASCAGIKSPPRGQPRTCQASETAAPAPSAAADSPPAPPGGDGLPPGETVPAVLIESRRIKGDKLIVPSDDTRKAMVFDGISTVKAVVQICIDARGVPERVGVVTSSCYADYDALIVRRVKDWRYTPFVRNGTPIGVCTTLTMVFSQR